MRIYKIKNLFPQPASFLFFLVVLFIFNISASVAKKDFDHFNTGFPLSGQHIKVDCESCHLKGTFKGTPKTCNGCHNGRAVSSKGAKHIASTSTCDDCHTTFSWDVAAVDHSSVKGTCKSCHRLPRGHYPTIAQCDECHPSTIAWELAHFDHSQVSRGCSSCHQKPRNHIPSSNNCEECHNFFSGWKFYHGGISAACSSCHSDDKPPDHIATTSECNACHNTFGWEGAVASP